jgi:hypothetical protein
MQLSEIELRILSELEEAGEENVCSMANTIFPPTGSSSEIDQLQAALGSLVARGLVRMGERVRSVGVRPLSKEDSQAVVEGIRTGFIFDSAKEQWWWTHLAWPEIVDTEAGKLEARKILDQRGYQWWRPQQ